MNTKVVVKEIIAIDRSNDAIALFHTVETTERTLSADLSKLATILAAQVAHLKLPTSAKHALIESTYAPEFKTLAANRNTVATLRALMVCKLAGSLQVEITPPSADGKVGAVFAPANKLSPSAAKKHLAEIKAEIREEEQSPEQKKLALAQARVAAAKAKEEKQNAEIKALLVKQEEAFAFCLSDSARPELIKRLAAIGFDLVKSRKAPKKD